VRLYQTNIVTIRSNGDVCLSSGGWRTYQTFKGLNAALRSLAPSVSVVADGPIYENRWRVVSPGLNGAVVSAPFHDGMTVPAVAAASLVPRKLREEPAAIPSSSVPPADYVCKICKVAGHWIQNCPKAPETPKPPPAGYVCKICRVPGHWIQNCPSTMGETIAVVAAKETKSAISSHPALSHNAPKEAKSSRMAHAPSFTAPVAAQDALVDSLHDLSGEPHERCRKALQVSNGDVNAAAELLLSGQDPSQVGHSSDGGWTRR